VKENFAEKEFEEILWKNFHQNKILIFLTNFTESILKKFCGKKFEKNFNKRRPKGF
jgi:hypothetical protein